MYRFDLTELYLIEGTQRVAINRWASLFPRRNFTSASAILRLFGYESFCVCGELVLDDEKEDEQVDTLAPVLFSMGFKVMLVFAYEENSSRLIFGR